MGKRRQKLEAAFRLFDKDNSGTLSCDEFKAVLQRNVEGGLAMSDEDIQELLETFDKNEDGVLQISEFIDAMEMINGDDSEDEDEDEDGDGDDEEAPVAVASSAASGYKKPEGWLGFELGIFNGREQLKAFAPIGTDLDDPMDGMITGKDDDGNVCFVVTMAQADDTSVDAAALEAAVTDFTETYDAVTNVQKELLPDGYVFTAQNEPEIGGTNFWVFSRRFFPSKGKAWNIEATAASDEQQAYSVAFAKSINDDG